MFWSSSKDKVRSGPALQNKVRAGTGFQNLVGSGLCLILRFEIEIAIFWQLLIELYEERLSLLFNMYSLVNLQNQKNKSPL